ncbi:hypothetical protein ES703_35125 [subsurface metagenome]
MALHKCWIPTKTHKIDIELTVEKYLRELHKDYDVDSFNYDPYQFHRSGVSLAKEGLKMCEYPQTTDRLVECGENLYSLIKGRNLSVYEDREIRDHILKSIAKESSRGFRLIKSKQSERIDLAISLAMSCVKAVNIDNTSPRVRAIGGSEDLTQAERRRQFIESDDDDNGGGNLLVDGYHQL